MAAVIEAHKAEVSQRITAAGAAIEGGVAARSAQARAMASTSRQQLRQQVAGRRTEATGAADEQARLAAEGGDTKAQRAVRTSGEVEERNRRHRTAEGRRLSRRARRARRGAGGRDRHRP